MEVVAAAKTAPVFSNVNSLSVIELLVISLLYDLNEGDFLHQFSQYSWVFLSSSSDLLKLGKSIFSL